MERFSSIPVTASVFRLADDLTEASLMTVSPAAITPADPAAVYEFVEAHPAVDVRSSIPASKKPIFLKL